MTDRVLEKTVWTLFSPVAATRLCLWSLLTPGRFGAQVTDQTMPRVTGTDLANRLLARQPDLPIAGGQADVRELLQQPIKPAEPLPHPGQQQSALVVTEPG